ncbi:lipoprotein [Sorangium cellulosum]|uniref:Lipoprotein n=1 Tax=Sorangium cellulosum TaxID=56 RepID=A0A4P2PZR3_SORCE|nr:lipoprotein [Sorangium cellulosum]
MVSIEPTRQANGAPLAAETAVASLPSRRGGRPRSRIEALARRPLFWIALVAVVALFSIGRAVLSRPPEPALRIPLPAFELTDHRGQRFGLEQLRGRVWIADFIFTTCPTVCPKLTQRMKEIEQRGRELGDALHLVTITVDPETDTPEVLASYAASQGLPLDRWTLLTGPLDQIESTVIKGFKIAMGKEEASPGLFSIFHGERLVLVDREGVIRGYYEANDEGISAILRDASALAERD